MKRRLLAAGLVGFVLVASSGTASAGPDTWAQLGAILEWLREVRQTVQNIAGTAESMRAKIQKVYPDNVRREIQTFLEPVTSIKQELDRLACGWQFSLRMQKLHLALFNGGRFCRNEFRGIFGAPVRTPLSDLDELEDQKATLRIDAVGEFNRKSDAWRKEAAELLRETKAGAKSPTDPYSPGYSQRLAALGAAQLGNLLLETGKLEAQYLDMTNDRILRRRMKDRLEKTYVLAGYAALAGQSWTAPATSPGRAASATTVPELPSVLP